MSHPVHERRSPAHASRWLHPIGPTSQAATAIAIYTMLVLSRLPEFFSFLSVARPILLLALASAAFAFSLPRNRLQTVLASREMRGVLGIMVLAIITVPTALWPGQSFRMVLFGLSKTVLFFFLLLYCIRTFRELRRLAWAAAGAAGVLGLAIVLLSAVGRASVGGTYDPNDTAFVMVCLLPIVVMLMVAEEGRRRWLLATVVGLCLLTIIRTGSRGGFVALLVVALILIAKLPSRKAGLRIGIVAGGALVFILFAPQSYWDRIVTIWGGESEVTRTDRYVAAGISGARWEVWKIGVQIMLENPLLGVGMGNFSVAEGMTHAGRKLESNKFQAPHNSFTQIGAELGVFGLGLLLYLLYRGVRNCRAAIRLAKRSPDLRYHLYVSQGIEAGLYGYMVGGFALSHAYTDIVYFLIATSVLLRWTTARASADLTSMNSGVRDRRGPVPWWKAPR